MKANLACNCSGKEEERKKERGSHHAYRRDRYCPELEEGKVCYIYVEGDLQLLMGISEVTLTRVNRVLRASTFYQYARDR